MKLTVDGTSLGGGLTGLAGDVTANQTVSGLAGSFTAPAVSGTSATNVFSANWVEDQSVIGATPGTQTSTASVTVYTFDHASGVLGVTSPTRVNAIAGATINSTSTFQNAGANNVKLTVDGTSLGGGLTGLAGDVTANQTVGGLTGSFTAPAVSGTSATNVFSANWVEDQSVIGATPGTQTSTASVTVNTFDHASGVLA